MSLRTIKKHISSEKLSPSQALELKIAEESSERFSLEDMKILLSLRKALEVEHV